MKQETNAIHKQLQSQKKTVTCSLEHSNIHTYTYKHMQWLANAFTFIFYQIKQSSELWKILSKIIKNGKFV